MYLPPDIPLTVTSARMPSGRAGALRTIRAMRGLVNLWRTDPGMISLAVSTIFLQPSKDSASELTAIFEYVRDHIRYTRDVLDVETLNTPPMTVARRVGDCDDKATLLATLAESVGYPSRFVMAAFHDSPGFSHVWVQLLDDSGWVDADATEENESLGWCPSGITDLYIER